MSLSISDWLLLSLFLISLPLYLVFLYTLYKYRKKEPFDSAFFKLCFSLGIFDIYMLLDVWLLAKFPMFGWLWIDELIKLFPRFFAKFYMMGTWVCVLGQFLGVLLMALNRLTALVFMHKHPFIWDSRNVKLALVVHWLVPLVLVSPQLGLDFHYLINETTDEMGAVMWGDPLWQSRYFTLLLFSNATVNLATFVCYGVIVVALNLHIQSFAALQDSNANQEPALYRSDVRLTIFGFVMFSLMLVYGVYAFLMSQADAESFLVYAQIFWVIADVFSWANPYFAIAFSKDVRAHMKAVITGRNVNEIVSAVVPLDSTANKQASSKF